MTHFAPMADSDGEFSQPEFLPDFKCHKCQQCKVSVESWDSSCGGYTDYKYTCAGCGKQWWVDGIDS